ncbi:MAG: ExbD/TolR family protein [Myxococcota bacterium]
MGIQVGKDQPGGMDEINVTPLIDVVLVLLIIFMVLTPITVQKMASNLPPPDMEEPPEPPPDQPPDQLLVAVYADGSLALNLETLADEELRKQVTRRLRSKEKKTVFIDAHPDANYGRVVNVMDMVREAGASKVGLAEMKDEGPAKLEPGAVLPGEGGAPVPVPVPPTP